MSRNKIYTIATDIFHMCLGAITILLAKHIDIISYFITAYAAHALPFVLIAAYMAYQVVDDDPPEERLGDMVEFAAGMILALAL